MEKVKVVVCGASGRMGSIIAGLAFHSDKFILKGLVEEKNSSAAGKEQLPGKKIENDLAKILSGDEVVIDFTVPSATMEFLNICEGKKTPIVIGTTGFDNREKQVIKEKSEIFPVFLAPNMSLGVNLYFEIIKFAAKLLKNYEIEIVESHHHDKKDAPSGTAKKVAGIICDVRKKKYEDIIKYGRQGQTGPRSSDEIGMHSMRLSDVVGEHYVYFGGKGEIVEISHKCFNRESFALGALKAADFLTGKQRGLFGMKDVIKEVMDV
jgi:4-hydroxy-tetrahydrodipicolinate reductase